MFKKEVLIKIKGTQRYREEPPQVMELFTVGLFYNHRGLYHIAYDETEATGYEGNRTTVRLDNEHRITMTRSGPNPAQLIIEEGVRHQCQYYMEEGYLIMGISGVHIVSRLNDDGGRLKFRYTLDINANETSENEVSLLVMENKYTTPEYFPDL